MLRLLTVFFLAMALNLSAQQKPNFVFILVDDLGWADLSCYGSTSYDTPNLDKLAESGVRFTQAYAGGSVCSPTRASILTGRSPARLNITDWIPGMKAKNPLLEVPKILNELPHSEVTIAEVLKENGYNTYYCGKWHLGHEDHFPDTQGFDVNIAGLHKGSPPGGYYSPYKNPKLPDGPKGEYLPDRLTNESIKIFEKEVKDDKPFLLYLSYYTVHTPIQASKRHIAKYKSKLAGMKNITVPEGPDGVTQGIQNNAAYASMVEAMDENIGRLIQKLDDLKLSDNTVVIFTSDNGGLATKRTPGPTSNAPLRSGKGWCYEGGIRTPLIIKAPGTSQKGLINEAPVISMDYFPTILELADIPLKPELHQDGLSLKNNLTGSQTVDREVLAWHYPHYHGSTWRPGAAIRVGDWKMIEFFETGKKELYNLKNDIGESKDLAPSHPEVLQKMTTKMSQWRTEHNAQMPTPIRK